MGRNWLAGAAAFAVMVIAVPAQAGGGSSGGPVLDPGDCTLTDTCETPGDGGDGGDGNPGGGGTGSGGPTGPSATPPYSFGSGMKLFTLDTLPTGPSGTQAYYQPGQDNSSWGLPFLPSAQGVLQQTVSGTTVSFHTDTFVLGSGTPLTSIRVENDSTNFGYLGVPAGVQVGILATAFGPQAGPIYVNFTDALSYFSINLYRLSGDFDVSSLVEAFSGVDGTGDILGSTTGTITGGNNFAYTTVELANLAGARSFKLNGSFLSNYDDITATAAVPEPTTWAMFIGGFGLIGAAMRRKKAVVRFV